MTQASTLSSSGMYSRFTLTQVLRTVDLNYAQLIQVLHVLAPNRPFHKKALVLVDKVEQKNGGRIRQVNLLKAVLISNDLYQESLVANPGVVPYIVETRMADDFFIPDDRLTRTVLKLSPNQSRLSLRVGVPVGGVVDVGVPFVDATLVVTPSAIVPSSTNGGAGTVTFGVGDVGKTVTLSYVTGAVHPTILITRQEKQSVTPELVISNEVLGVILNPTLAGLLGLTLPAY